jgi:hypothetical protein
LLTNHHCGYSQIQSHSSVEKDYLADGFGPIKWKTNCQTRVWLTLYGKIEDVTTQILEGTALANEGDKQKKFKKTSPDWALSERILARKQNSYLYEGNQYLLL